MGILSGNPKNEPLHYGEIYGIWQFSTAAKLSVPSGQLYLNHVGDKDLKQFIEDLVEQAKLEISECDELLINNGVATSPAMAEKPKVNLEDIPPGARFVDPEIASMVAAANAAGIVACSEILSTCIREDVGMLFEKYHAKKVSLSFKLLRMSKDKGWIIPPPLQVKTPEPAHV